MIMIGIALNVMVLVMFWNVLNVGEFIINTV